MFYDLNVPWPKDMTIIAGQDLSKAKGDARELFRTVSMLYGLGYRTIAFDFEITGKGTTVMCPIRKTDFSKLFPDLSILSRATLIFNDAAQAQAIPSLTSKFDILAIRPNSEKLLQAACTALDVDLISLDLSSRMPFPLRYRVLGAAIGRGLKFEITYSASVSNSADQNQRRNLIANASALFRATRGHGIIISSAAKNALVCRGPYDIANLATLWGFTQEKGKQAIDLNCRAVCVHAHMRRKSFKQAVEIPADLIEQLDENLGRPAKKRKKN
ncbi:RNase P subunit p30-domain-containing protein [Lipomyces oligophaga]|uniref:RNase P subunit p30-domain-containing protein n=1 Tax=Lipomyces oligophaga TaxID=45792 RepID=UPI0034CF72CB